MDTHSSTGTAPPTDESPLLPTYLRRAYRSTFPLGELRGSHTRLYQVDYVTAVDATTRHQRKSMQQQQPPPSPGAMADADAGVDYPAMWQPYYQQQLTPEQQMQYQQWLYEESYREAADQQEQWQRAEERQRRKAMDVDMYRFIGELTEHCMSKCFLMDASHAWRPEGRKILKRERECVRRCARGGILLKMHARQSMTQQMQTPGGMEQTIFGDTSAAAAAAAAPSPSSYYAGPPGAGAGAGAGGIGASASRYAGVASAGLMQGALAGNASSDGSGYSGTDSGGGTSSDSSTGEIRSHSGAESQELEDEELHT